MADGSLRFFSRSSKDSSSELPDLIPVMKVPKSCKCIADSCRKRQYFCYLLVARSLAKGSSVADDSVALREELYECSCCFFFAEKVRAFPSWKSTWLVIAIAVSGGKTLQPAISTETQSRVISRTDPTLNQVECW